MSGCVLVWFGLVWFGLLCLFTVLCEGLILCVVELGEYHGDEKPLVNSRCVCTVFNKDMFQCLC